MHIINIHKIANIHTETTVQMASVLQLNAISVNTTEVHLTPLFGVLSLANKTKLKCSLFDSIKNQNQVSK